jgi:dipeptidyl aminopeptidase/acylaminoacyl peptidase
MNYIAFTVAGLLAVVALVVAASWVWARHFCTPRRRPYEETPDDYNLPSESVQFPSHGATLRGWFIQAKAGSASRPAVVLSHGWSQNAAKMLPMASRLHEAGFGVLLYDARGHGKSDSDGPMTIYKFAQDLMAAAAYVEKRPDVDEMRLGVVGHSLGGSGAILAASKEPRIRALVTVSAFADPEEVTRRVMRHLHIPRWPFPWLVCRIIERWVGTTITDISPYNRIAHIRAPLFLIHGDADQFVPPYNMEALYARAPQQHTRSWLVPGGEHSDIVNHPDLIARVIAFLEKSLASEPAEMSDGDSSFSYISAGTT